jgi:plastocyanin
MLSRTGRATAPLLAVLAALLGSVLLAAPASAADRVVTVTAEGVMPKVLTVAVGDTVTFVNEGTRLDLVARSTSPNWSFSSTLPVLPGRSYTVPAEEITGPGTYTYALGEDDEEPFTGSVVVPAPPAPSPRPAGPAASGGGGPAPGGGGTAPPPAQGGGTGTAQPPVPGGFGPVPGPAGPAPGGLAPGPSIALPELPAEEPVGPAPETAEEPKVAPGAGPLAVPGRLGVPAGYRGYGLPSALAVVLAAGVASLLVRLLLAEPAARRAARGTVAGGTPVATVD